MRFAPRLIYATRPNQNGMQKILGLSWCHISGTIGKRGRGMAFSRNWRANVCAYSVLLVFVPALGMPAQQPQGTGSAPAKSSQGNPLATSSSIAGTASKSDSTPPAQPGAAQAKPTLADFAWLAGRWQGAWGPRVAQQVWMPPKAGVMPGTFQLVDNGTTLVIELFTIIEKPDGINLYFRHFTPTLAPWETSKPTVLKLANSTPKVIEFENPVGGQPKSAVIRRIDADTYVSRSVIVPDKGDTQTVEITYHRQRETGSAKR
jgi:hypothetical protein